MKQLPSKIGLRLRELRHSRHQTQESLSLSPPSTTPSSRAAFCSVPHGQARILVHVTVSDLSSGNQIDVFEAEGKTVHD